ncbi:MAG: M23 family metallopeptidase [Oligoflexia bacterium]|nr:M23 family metallopeptidase [Oligoflexia bacterium]
MKLLNKDYCLWIVPPNEGKVRKYRLTLRRVIAAFVAAMMLGGVFVYMLGDYARLQISRVETYFSLRKLTSERNNLLERTQSLRAQVQDLQHTTNKAANYEADIKLRLEQLAGLVESATSLGVFDKRGAVKPDKKEGVGGAEIDCKGSSCDGLPSADSGDDSPMASWSGQTPANDPELVALLDKLIEAIKVIPFGLPAVGDVSSFFGVRVSPFEHSLRMHEGIDFSLPYGAKVFSSAFGEVAEVGWNSTYGLRVDVRHNNRIITRYAHLSKALVRPGQKIARGDVIGLAGSTGRSTGPHLHFEVLVDRQPKNPARFLELAKKLDTAL